MKKNSKLFCNKHIKFVQNYTEFQAQLANPHFSTEPRYAFELETLS